MFQRVLVPLDGSALAEQALTYARSLVTAARGTLILVRAANHHGLTGDLAVRERDAVDAAQTYLEGQAQTLEAAGFSVEIGVTFGDAAAHILDEVAIRHADAIAMATHGRSGLGRWVYGSVAERLLAHSPVPVLLVRAWVGDAQSAQALLAKPKVLVPLDGSPFAEAALPTAVGAAEGLTGELLLLQATVMPTEPVMGPDNLVIANVDQLMESLEGAADDYLAEVEQRLRREHPGLMVSRKVATGVASLTIDEVADGEGAGLIVMATHGRTGVGRTVLGSVAGDVLRFGRTPVLLMRPGGLTPAEAESSVSLLLNAGEVDLLRSALQQLRDGSGQTEPARAQADALLARLGAAREGTSTVPTPA